MIKVHSLYRHKYGGVYHVVAVATSTVDKSRHVVYNHIWPFDDEDTYIRPIEEWTDDRFTQFSDTDFLKLRKSVDEYTAQRQVTEKRNASNT